MLTHFLSIKAIICHCKRISCWKILFLCPLRQILLTHVHQNNRTSIMKARLMPKQQYIRRTIWNESHWSEYCNAIPRRTHMRQWNKVPPLLLTQKDNKMPPPTINCCYSTWTTTCILIFSVPERSFILNCFDIYTFQ